MTNFSPPAAATPGTNDPSSLQDTTPISPRELRRKNRTANAAAFSSNSLSASKDSDASNNSEEERGRQRSKENASVSFPSLRIDPHYSADSIRSPSPIHYETDASGRRLEVERTYTRSPSRERRRSRRSKNKNNTAKSPGSDIDNGSNENEVETRNNENVPKKEDVYEDTPPETPKKQKKKKKQIPPPIITRSKNDVAMVQISENTKERTNNDSKPVAGNDDLTTTTSRGIDRLKQTRLRKLGHSAEQQKSSSALNAKPLNPISIKSPTEDVQITIPPTDLIASSNNNDVGVTYNSQTTKKDKSKDVDIVFAEEGGRYRLLEGVKQSAPLMMRREAVDPGWEGRMLQMARSYESMTSTFIYLLHLAFGGLCISGLILFPMKSSEAFTTYYTPLSNIVSRVFIAFCTGSLLNALNVTVTRKSITDEEGNTYAGRRMGWGVRSIMVFVTFVAYILTLVILSLDDRMWFSSTSPHGGIYSTNYTGYQAGKKDSDLHLFTILTLIRNILGVISLVCVVYERKLVRDSAPVGNAAGLVRILRNSVAPKGDA